MGKEFVDQQGNIFIATKLLIIKFKEMGKPMKMDLPCKDIDTVQECISELKKEFLGKEFKELSFSIEDIE